MTCFGANATERAAAAAGAATPSPWSGATFVAPPPMPDARLLSRSLAKLAAAGQKVACQLQGVGRWAYVRWMAQLPVFHQTTEKSTGRYPKNYAMEIMACCVLKIGKIAGAIDRHTWRKIKKDQRTRRSISVAEFWSSRNASRVHLHWVPSSLFFLHFHDCKTEWWFSFARRNPYRIGSILLGQGALRQLGRAGFSVTNFSVTLSQSFTSQQSLKQPCLNTRKYRHDDKTAKLRAPGPHYFQRSRALYVYDCRQLLCLLWLSRLLSHARPSRLRIASPIAK